MAKFTQNRDIRIYNVSTDGTPRLVCNKNPRRFSLLLKNNGQEPILIGTDEGLATTGNYYLYNQESLVIDDFIEAIYCVSAGGNAGSLHVVEQIRDPYE